MKPDLWGTTCECEEVLVWCGSSGSWASHWQEGGPSERDEGGGAVAAADGDGDWEEEDEDGESDREGKEDGWMLSATRRTPPGLRKAARRWVAREMEGRWWYARTH